MKFYGILLLACLVALATGASVEDKKEQAEEPKPVEDVKAEDKVAPVAAAAAIPEDAKPVDDAPSLAAVEAEQQKPKPEPAVSQPAAVVKPAEDAQARQGGHQLASNRQGLQGPSQFIGNLLQPLNPGNFLSNLLPGRNERRQIGEPCQYSSDCLAGTDNSVCFNGTCLCNLGYRYTADTKTCTPVDTCPTCTADTCSSGTDVYCNGTCIRNMKAITIKGLGETGKMMLSSPNWPENYPAGTDVYYCISASAGRRVNIRFDWMDLETNCGYNCDYVRVYNGCVGKSSELVAMFHGDNARSRECVTSTCNQMLVHFHTDADKGGRGDQRSGFMGFIREATYTNDLCNKCASNKS